MFADTNTSITTVTGFAKAGTLSDLLNAVKIQGPYSYPCSSWEVTAFTIVFTGKNVTSLNCELNKAANAAMADMGGASLTDAAASVSNNPSWMSAKKLNASVSFDPLYRNMTQISLFAALAKENAQVSPTLQFTDATIAIRVSNPFSATRQWEIGLTGKLTVGAATINAALTRSSATDRTQIDGSITGMPFLSVLRNFVPLIQAPSQLERLDVTSFRLIIKGTKIQFVSCELNQLDASTVISTVGGDGALAAAKNAPQQVGKMDWLQLKKVVVQADLDDTSVNVTVSRVHVFTKLLNDEVVAEKITLKDVQVQLCFMWYAEYPLHVACCRLICRLRGRWTKPGVSSRPSSPETGSSRRAA
jgi:hypothetical protein